MPDSKAMEDVHRPVRSTRCLGWKQLGSLLWKNGKIKARQPCQTFVELISPMLVASLFVLGFSFSEPDVNKATIYANDTAAISNFADAVEPFLIPPDQQHPWDFCPIPHICLNTTYLAHHRDELDDQVREFVENYRGPLPIPDVSTFNQIKNFIEITLGIHHIPLLYTNGPLENATHFSSLFNGKLAFAPGSDSIDVQDVYEITDRLASKNPIYYEVYNTADDAINAAMHDAEKGNIYWAVFILKEYNAGNRYSWEKLKVDVEIRMNFTRLPSTKKKKDEFNVGLSSQFYKYFTSGFLTLQKMIQDDVLSQSASLREAPIPKLNIDVASLLPLPEIHSNEFYQRVGALTGLVLCLGTLYPVSRLIKALVEDKQTKTRETLKIMGVRDWAVMSSWFITAVITFILAATGMSLMLTESGIIANSSKSLLWTLIAFTLFSLVCMSFLIASIFDRAKLAGIVGPIVVFITVIPRYALFSADIDTQGTTKTFVSLLSPSAFSFAMDTIMTYEGANRGVTWKNFNEHALPVSRVLLILLVDSFLYLCLAYYLSQVLPKEYGVRKPWYFCLVPNSCKNSKDGSGTYRRIPSRRTSMVVNESKNVQDSIQGVEEMEVKAVDAEEEDYDPICEQRYETYTANLRIFDLKKTYSNGVRAVKGLNLDIHSGEITVLLGHNGAGKSTTLGILTGLLPPTSGDAQFQGKSILNEMESIRSEVGIGICPQHSVLFPDLTCKEHVELYASLKGIPCGSTGYQSARLLELVGLDEKTHARSSSLSGGMKRKLSVAIALVGGPFVVFLDEPTSGMDPKARRDMWEIFRNFRKNRCLLLTTHFMDEADFLGDNIAILAEGRLQCAGSPLFLKTTFGTGYNLIFSMEDNFSLQKLDSLVKKYIPKAECTVNAQEVAYVIPFDGITAFASLLKELEKRQSEIEYQAYGVSMTKLEQVFMALATGKDPHELASRARIRRDSKEELKSLNIDGAPKENEKEDREGTDSKPYPRRDSTDSEDARCCNELFGREKTTETKRSGEGVYARLDIESNGSTSIVSSKSAGFCTQLFELLKKRARCAVRDWKGRIFEIVLPVVVVALTLLILRLNINPAGPSISLSAALYEGSENYLSENLVPVFKDALDSYNSSVTWVNSHSDTGGQVSAPLLNEYYEHDKDRVAGIVKEDIISIDFNHLKNKVFRREVNFKDLYTVLHNSTYIHALPSFYSECTRARLTVSNDDPEIWNISNHPLPLTNEQKLLISLFLSLFAALFVLVPFCYIPAAFASFPVRERASKAKQQQKLAGVGPVVYWISNFLWDLVNYLFICGFVMIVFLGYGNAEFTGSTNAKLATLALLSLYGLAAIPLGYCFSFLFSNPTSTQVGISGLNFLFGFLLVIASFVLDAIEKTKDTNSSLKPYYRIFPGFNLGEGLIQLSAIKWESEELGMDKSPLQWDVTLRNMMYLGAECIAYLLLTILIEVRKRMICSQLLTKLSNRRVMASSKIRNALSEARDNLDSDVRKERERVSDSPINGVLVLEGLTKVYNRKTIAVKESYLAINEGVCFGLLGLNGAGKSTTIQMLTGDIQPTSGDARILGASLTAEFATVQGSIGLCPQTDPIFPRMTASEHLWMYGRLRGIPAHMIRRQTAELISAVGLEPFKHKTAGGYSGGNKRKLSLAIALIGSPKLIFLDEPSSGMDPVAKRKMWGLINKKKKEGISVILTTHSLEECEALCDRVGVMVSGTFKCLGPIQHLRSKFGSGYELEITLHANGNFEKIEKFLVSSLGKPVETLEHHGQTTKFQLPRFDNVVESKSGKIVSDLGSLFQAVESNKEDLHIKDYSMSQTTLEQVFLKMAQEGESEMKENR